MNKYKKSGWYNESERHRLARQGIKTGRKIDYAEMFPKYDSRKSFYDKADVREEDGKLILKSYNTDVAYIKDGRAYVSGTYSPTTLRHIKEFLKQNGFTAESSSQIIKDYGRKEEKSEPSARITSKDDKPSISTSIIGTKFNLGGGITIVGRTTPSRSGFNHVVEYYKDGVLVDSAKVHYINRTWEQYGYETAISKLLDKVGVSTDAKARLMESAKNLAIGKTSSEYKSIANIASLGEVFGRTQKEKNDWKLRMLKAGLESKGLQVPDDWDTLSEDEKGARLGKIIKFMKEDKIDNAKIPVKENYAIEWTNSFGKRVIYPERTFKYKGSAESFSQRLKNKRLKSTGTVMKEIKIIKL